MPQNLRILYEDKYITITDIYILIKKYYMPLMTSKIIMLNEMKAIDIEDATNVNSRWGISTHFLNNWFQYDPDRKKKAKFISIQLKNKRIRPAITPQNVDKAFNILRNHFAENDRKSVMFQSNRDKETQFNQKEAHQMMKQQLQHEENIAKNQKQGKNQPNNIEQNHETTQQDLMDGKKEVKFQTFS